MSNKITSGKKNVLCLVPHRMNRSPGQRFRIEQYLPFLEQQGYHFVFSHIISEKDDAILYKKFNYIKKLFIFVRSIRVRRNDLKNLSEFDAVFIYREAVLHGSSRIERQIHKKGVPIIYDFDDSIWLLDVSEGNRSLRWLKRPSKVAEIIQLSTITVIGNNYLYQFASQHTKNARIIPTTIDTEKFQATNKARVQNKICIGWTGSTTTLKHLKTAIPFLKKLKDRYPEKISFKVIADTPLVCEELDYEFVKWSAQNETDDIQSIDIGIMPLPDDGWSKGKCGFKGLQYMAFEIPTVMSPVGVNTEIIDDGVNGFLASTEEEWIEKLSLLIESPELRSSLGKAGRKTVQEKYSFEVNKHKWLQVFDDVTRKV